MLCTVSRAGEVYDNAVKVTFLSWLTGSTKLSYERALANHQSAELCANVIGAGYDRFQNEPLGFTVRYGHKFFLTGYHYGFALWNAFGKMREHVALSFSVKLGVCF